MNGNEIITNIQGLDGAGKPAATTQTATLTQLVNFTGTPVLAGAVSATSNTTLAIIGSGAGAWSIPVVAAGVYVFEAYVSVTCNASGGLKLALSGSTCTATTLSVDTWTYNGTTVAAQGVITSLASNLVALTGAITVVNFVGSIIVNAAGLLSVSFAQNASFGTATTINPGSYFWIDRAA